MSRFLAFYNLKPIANPNEFLGTAMDRNDEHIIATLGKNMIVVINIKTQATIHSWTTVDKVSTKVVYDRYTQQYVGVFANYGLRLWDENCTDVNKCKKIRFKRPIADIITARDDTLVVFANGTCQLLQQAINTRQEEDDIDNATLQLNAVSDNLMHADITSFPNGQRLLTFFERDNDTNRLTLVRVPLYGSGEPTRYNLQRGNLDVTLVGYTVFESDVGPMLWTVWSDQRIFLMKLGDDTSSNTSPNLYVAMLNTLRVDKPITAVGVTRNTVAIYGANSTQEGASLLLYNTQYKLIRTQQFFKVHLETTRLFADERHIYIAMAQNLSVVVFDHSDVLLSDMMGMQCSNILKPPTLFHGIKEAEALSDSIKPVGENDLQAVTRPSTIKDIFRNKFQIQAADGSNVPYENSEAFDEILNELLERQLKVEVVKSTDTDVANNFLHIELMTNTMDKGCSTKQVQLLEDMLEQSGASEHEITEKLLTVLIATDELTEISNCLRRYSNISDKVIAKTLHYLLLKLSAEKGKNKSVLNGHSLENGQELTVKTEDALNILLFCKFDVNNLSFHIRRELKEENVLLFLQYIYDLLECTVKCDFNERPAQNPDCINIELQILRWFGIILNTHFQNLILNKNPQVMTLLLNFRQIFDLYRGDLNDLQSTAALLYNIVQRRKSFKTTSNKNWYKIEEISF